MKVITYNINGIRSAQKVGFEGWLKIVQPDILCLQEVKALPNQIDLLEIEAMGYFCNFHPAQKKGYSGVAVFSKLQPKNISTKIGVEEIDNEGRIIQVDFENYSVVSAYFPSGASGLERHFYILEFLNAFQNYISQLIKVQPNLIICGDLNICHQLKDIYDPIGLMQASGFLQEERDWLTDFLAIGFVDAFRAFNPNPHQYTWFSYMANAKQKNLGWRIDYILISKALERKLENAIILKSAPYSDHCPVVANLMT